MASTIDADVTQAHDDDIIMSARSSQITSFAIVYSTVYSRRRSKKTSKLRVTSLCGNSPHKGPVTQKKFPFDDIIIVFVKLEELHIATARKPLIHQNQPVAQYLQKIQPCML